MGGELSASDPRRPYYELELERMRWLLRAYLRTRLLKINTHAFTILLSPELKSRLTAAEVEYAEGYVTLVEEHVKASVTGRLKAGDDNCHVLAPSDLALLLPRQHDGVVFCRIDADAGQVDLGLSAGCAAARARQRRARGAHICPRAACAALTSARASIASARARRRAVLPSCDVATSWRAASRTSSRCSSRRVQTAAPPWPPLYRKRVTGAHCIPPHAAPRN